MAYGGAVEFVLPRSTNRTVIGCHRFSLAVLMPRWFSSSAMAAKVVKPSPWISLMTAWNSLRRLAAEPICPALRSPALHRSDDNGSWPPQAGGDHSSSRIRPQRNRQSIPHRGDGDNRAQSPAGLRVPGQNAPVSQSIPCNKRRGAPPKPRSIKPPNNR